MKRVFYLFCFLLICFSLFACGNKEKTDGVTIDLGESKTYSTEEIQSAVDCAMKEFESFKGCELTKIWYEETVSSQEGDSNTIVLLSNFRVDAAGGDGSFEPNSTQERWQWILTRDKKGGKWKVVNAGYAVNDYVLHALSNGT